MYGVQSSKSFLVGHRHVEIIGSSKERNKISNNISDRRYKQGQIWLVRRQDFHSFLNLWYGRHLRPGGTVSKIFMTRLIRLWNSPQGGSSNFRCPCKNLIFFNRIQLIATNLSWLVYFASLMEDELRRKTDTIILYHNAISREFQSRHESGAFVGKSIFSLWTLACQTKVISYAVSVTKWFYRQI